MNAQCTYDEICRTTDDTASLSVHLQITGPSFTRDDAVVWGLSPELKASSGMGRGNRHSPERPMMMAKACEEAGRGKLRVSSLPILTRMKVITETDRSIQTYCFSMEPEAVTIDEKEAGKRSPVASVVGCDVSNPITRTSDIEALQEFVITSLRQGNDVNVHYVTGGKQAVIVAASRSIILIDIKLKSAMDVTNQPRHVEFDIRTKRQWNTRYGSMEVYWMDENYARHHGTSDRQRYFERPMKTLAKINPQEANPEDADLPLQQTPVQAVQGTEKTDDFVPEQPTSLSGLNDTEKSAHLHETPLPVHTPPCISAQRFTVE